MQLGKQMTQENETIVSLKQFLHFGRIKRLKLVNKTYTGVELREASDTLCEPASR
jgi:hypothetical protein